MGGRGGHGGDGRGGHRSAHVEDKVGGNGIAHAEYEKTGMSASSMREGGMRELIRGVGKESTGVFIPSVMHGPMVGRLR